MRVFSCLALTACALFAGCASNRVEDCQKLAGPGWTELSKAPANAPDLLMLQNLPTGIDAVWLAKGPSRVMACVYSPPMNNPGCSNSTAYVFANEQGRWRFDNMLVDTCYQ